MNWQTGEEYGSAYGCAAYGPSGASTALVLGGGGGGGAMEQTPRHQGYPHQGCYLPQQQPPQHSQHPPQNQHNHPASHMGWTVGTEVSSAEIQLLNDDHEKAILSDLCDETDGPCGSTPLSTFSYISEYICSNNIDIWPGEAGSVGCASNAGAGTTFGCSLELKAGDQRSPATAGHSCVHQQLFFRCKRVLESIIARNEQILELLRQKQHQQHATGTCQRQRQQ